MAKNEIELEVAGKTLTISNPDRVYFPTGETKLDVIEYYLEVEEPLLAELEDRPLLLQRFPRGVTESSFFQKRIPDTAPDWLQTTTVSTVNGTESRALVAHDMAHIIWAVNLGCIGFHVWPTRSSLADTEPSGQPAVAYADMQVPISDRLRIDLDPSPGQTFEDIRTATAETKSLLDDLGLTSGIKTSGNKGLHIFIRLEPIWDSVQVRAAAITIARKLEAEFPEILTGRWWKEEREGKVFVDFNQNAPHKTVFGTWCVRPIEGTRVSTPFAWDELGALEPGDLTMQSVPQRLSSLGDPWSGLSTNSIETLVSEFAEIVASGGHDEPWPPQYPKQPNELSRVQPSRKKG